MALYTDYLVYEYGEDLEHDYVFISLKEGYFGKPLKYQSVLDLVRRIVKRTRIEFTPHMLRHTHATQLIRDGWDVAHVQKRLVPCTCSNNVKYLCSSFRSRYEK